jgi:hypothetical protein
MIRCVNKEAMANATTKAIAAIAVCAMIQLGLLFYSVSHPSASDLVTASFLFIMVFYPIVFEYHARKMKASNRRSSKSPLDSN